MNINSVEQSLAKFHVLHLVAGIAIALVLLLVPKVVGVFLAVFMAAILLPVVILPEFTESKWFDRAAVLAGAAVVAVVFHFLHKL